MNKDGYAGIFFMPANTLENKEIYKQEIYALEIHAFYLKEAEEILKEKMLSLFNRNKNDKNRKKAINLINKEIEKLPSIKTLVYRYIFKNIGTNIQLNFEQSSFILNDYDNEAPGKFLPINPEIANNFCRFKYDGIDMILLSGIVSIAGAVAILNAPGNLVDNA